MFLFLLCHYYCTYYISLFLVPRELVTALMNMLGHPVKFDIAMLIENVEQMMGLPKSKINMERLSGDRLLFHIAMKTGQGNCYMLHMEKKMIQFFGATVADMLQSIAFEIANIQSSRISTSVAIPPGQLITLVLEALDEKTNSIKKGNYYNMVRFDNHIKTALGNGFCNTSIKAVDDICTKILQQEYTEKNIYSDIFDNYLNNDLRSEEGQLYLKLLQYPIFDALSCQGVQTTVELLLDFFIVITRLKFSSSI